MGLINKKTKYKYVFLMKEYSTMNIVRIVVKKTPEKIIRLGKKSYTIDLEAPTYNYKNFKVYFIEYTNGGQLPFSYVQPKLNPEELDDIISNKIIRELASGVMDDRKSKLIMILLGVLIGGLIAYIIVSNIFQKRIDDLYEQFRDVKIYV